MTYNTFILFDIWKRAEPIEYRKYSSFTPNLIRAIYFYLYEQGRKNEIKSIESVFGPNSTPAIELAIHYQDTEILDWSNKNAKIKQYYDKNEFTEIGGAMALLRKANWDLQPFEPLQEKNDLI